METQKIILAKDSESPFVRDLLQKVDPPDSCFEARAEYPGFLVLDVLKFVAITKIGDDINDLATRPT